MEIPNGDIELVPQGINDDLTMIIRAQVNDGYILTNDHFRNWIGMDFSKFGGLYVMTEAWCCQRLIQFSIDKFHNIVRFAPQFTVSPGQPLSQPPLCGEDEPAITMHSGSVPRLQLRF